MTPRRQRRVSLPKSKTTDYRHVAEDFYSGAELAKEFEYWNAAGVLIVHAAIAYTDAITIRRGGLKSKGEDHLAAVALLRELVPLDERGKRATRQFERIVHEKNRVSYEAKIFTRKDIDLMWKQIERYRTWARSMLEE